MTPDTSDIAARLRDMNAALADWDRIRQEGEQISREEAYQVLTAEIAALRAENERRREEARRLTQQDGLTDAEREAMEWCLGWSKGLHVKHYTTLLSLLERMT